MKKLAILLLFWQCYMLHAQELAFDKVLHSNSTNSVSSKAIATDKQSNIYLLGQFTGEAIVETNTLKATGKTDVFLAKFNNESALLWIKQISGPGYINAHSIVLDGDNNIYISGTFGNTASFGGKSLKATSYQDNFIAKYSNNGDILWINHIQAITKAYKTVLAVGNQGQLFFAGSFLKNLQIGDISMKAESNADIFIAELDKEGSFKQVAQITGQHEEKLFDMECSASGDLFLTGSFQKTISFGTETFQSNGEEDIFIAKYSGLSFEWAKTMGSPYCDYGSKILLKENELIAGGCFSDEISADNTVLKSSGALDAFIISYANDGKQNWASKFGGPANEYLNAMEMNNAGQLYLSGNFRGEIQKDTSNLKSHGLINDLFLAKYDADGSFIWAKNYGGKGSDYAVDLLQSADNYLYLTGEFENKITFENQEIESGEDSNFFISRFYDCYQNKKINLEEDVSACGSEYLLKAEDGFVTYQWSNGLSGQQIPVEASGNYSVTATDSLGCQSSDELGVTLHPFPEIKLPGTQHLCPDASLRLDAGEGYATYLWNNGAKSRRINVQQAGEYQVELSNEFGCKALISFIVEQVTTPSIDLADKYQVTKGDGLIIQPNKNFAGYLWNNGQTKNELSIDSKTLEVGIYHYWLELTDKFNCQYTHEFKVEVNKPVENETLSDPIIAKADPNPSDGKFNLRLENIPKNEKLELKVFTASGMPVKYIDAGKSNNNFYQHEINLQTLSKGIYLMTITIGEKSTSKEIIIN